MRKELKRSNRMVHIIFKQTVPTKIIVRMNSTNSRWCGTWHYSNESRYHNKIGYLNSKWTLNNNPLWYTCTSEYFAESWIDKFKMHAVNRKQIDENSIYELNSFRPMQVIAVIYCRFVCEGTDVMRTPVTLSVSANVVPLITFVLSDETLSFWKVHVH